MLLAVQYGDVGGALQRLSPELRAVVQATVLDGLTTREAAQLLGIPAGTVKTRMMRARAQRCREAAGMTGWHMDEAISPSMRRRSAVDRGRPRRPRRT